MIHPSFARLLLKLNNLTISNFITAAATKKTNCWVKSAVSIRRCMKEKSKTTADLAATVLARKTTDILSVVASIRLIIALLSTYFKMRLRTCYCRARLFTP